MYNKKDLTDKTIGQEELNQILDIGQM